MSFYRTYRPQIIEDIDNASVRATIELLRTKPKNQLPHAFLFSGPKGTGKTSTARIIAKLFNCTKPDKQGGPCGKCDECRAIAEGRELDVIEMDAASNRGIDEIRSLRDSIALAPSGGGYKIFIIDEVHMLTTEAFNALLKTLEEPPVHAVFVLATTDPQKIPATILSRCLHVNFARAKNEDLTRALKRIVHTEKIEIDENALDSIVTNADGSFRDAVKMLEQVSFHKGVISQEVAEEMLALSRSSRRDTFLVHLRAKALRDALSDIRELSESGVDVKAFLVDCLRTLESQLVTAVQVKSPDKQQTIELSNLISRLTRGFTELRSSPIPELPLELAVVEYCHEETAGDNNVQEPVTHTISITPTPQHIATQPQPQKAEEPPNEKPYESLGLLTLEKLTEHWRDIIDELKPYNHSVAAVCRSARPKEIKNGIVVIEAFYKFHQEKLSEVKTREMISVVLKKLFGEKVRVEVVLGKK